MGPLLMRFEERELKTYAEPVTATDLVAGQVYFSVQFADDQLLIPIMETWVFAGRKLRTGDTEDVLYFQDLESYLQGVRHGTSGDNEARFQIAMPTAINQIFDYEHALDELMKCALRRRQGS
jgi:hypothetical protein